MIFKTITVTILISLWSNSFFSQTERIILDKKTFDKTILNNGWSAEDTLNKKTEESFFIFFINDTINVTYINWLIGLNGAHSKYKLSFKDNFMEVKGINWLSDVDKSSLAKINNIYFYFYLKSNNELFFIFSEKKITQTEKLIKNKEWIKLSNKK